MPFVGAWFDSQRIGHRPTRFRLHCQLCAGILLSLVPPQLQAAAVVPQIEIVATTGEQALGAVEGLRFHDFGKPVLNNAGQTAFYARVGGSTLAPAEGWGIWSESGGRLGAVALDGALAPDIDDRLVFTGLWEGSFSFNDRGQLAYRGLLVDAVTREDAGFGVWLDSNHSSTLIARSGSLAPTTYSDTVFEFFGHPVINRHGEIAFRGEFGGGSAPWYASEGIWNTVGGNVASIVIDQTAAPGTNMYTQFWGFPNTPTFNANGQAAFIGTVTNGPRGLWSYVGGSIDLVARVGNDVPGLGDGTRFGIPRAVVMDTTGDLLFYSRLTGTAVSESDDQSLWSFRQGELRLFAREGEQAPGLNDGIDFDSFLKLVSREAGEYVPAHPSISATGDIAFLAGLRGPGVDESNRQSIWRKSANELELIVRAGELAPGIDSGVYFDRFSGPMLNVFGRIAFQSHITGDGVHAFNDSGIWAEDVNGQLTLIAREGDLVDLDRGPGVDLRRIRDVEFFGTTDGATIFHGTVEDNAAAAFNRLGQIAFRAYFIDGTRAILISNLVAVPEPTTNAALTIGLVFAISLCHPRRRLRFGGQ